MRFDHKAIVEEIDGIVSLYLSLRSKSQHSDCSDLPVEERAEMLSVMIATANRYAPPGSYYQKEINKLTSRTGALITCPQIYLAPVVGLLRGMRQDYQNGRMVAVHELIHADVFSDMLDQAQYLLKENYKDPAAVVASAVLEEHIRKLCDKNGVSIKETGGTTRKTQVLNQDLRQAGVYDKNEEKNVTAWLGLRNSAAHGHYGDYDEPRVALFIASIRDFVTRHPA